jgi:glutamate formiminotransferase / 5-formyltetrahydrofolate cyclo-ligase
MMSQHKIIECVINISEGKDQRIIDQIVEPFMNTPLVKLMNVEADADYHRTVISVMGESQALVQSVIQSCERAINLIDLRKHQGEHPRMGAVDVVPFIPIAHATMDDCIACAHEVAKQLAKHKEVPIYLYEEAATHPDRKNLATIRKGEFEGLAEKMKQESFKPDYGPHTPHPSAGAIAIGARMPLIAYNIDLATDDVAIAKAIAKSIRFSSGGFECVKAGGVKIEQTNTTQVTMNLTNYQITNMHVVYDEVVSLAASYGTDVTGSEIVGLIPLESLLMSVSHYLKFTHPLKGKILDDFIKEIDS